MDDLEPGERAADAPAEDLDADSLISDPRLSFMWRGFAMFLILPAILEHYAK